MADEIEPPNGQTESVYLKPGVDVRIGQFISEDMVDRNRKRIPVMYYDEIKPGDISRPKFNYYFMQNVPLVNEGGRQFFVHTWK